MEGWTGDGRHRPVKDGCGSAGVGAGQLDQGELSEDVKRLRRTPFFGRQGKCGQVGKRGSHAIDPSGLDLHLL